MGKDCVLHIKAGGNTVEKISDTVNYPGEPAEVVPHDVFFRFAAVARRFFRHHAL
jgi:hypothetical protein